MGAPFVGVCWVYYTLWGWLLYRRNLFYGVGVGCGALVVGQSWFESEFPPSTAAAVPLPPKGDGSSRAPASQSLG